MNIEQLRISCLSLMGVTEDQPFGDDIITFRIEGKIFLCLWLYNSYKTRTYFEPHFSIKLLPERNEELRAQFSNITPAWHWNKKHWSDVYYETFDDSFIIDLVKESRQLIISKLPKSKRQKYL